MKNGLTNFQWSMTRQAILRSDGAATPSQFKRTTRLDPIAEQFEGVARAQTEIKSILNYLIIRPYPIRTATASSLMNVICGITGMVYNASALK